MGKSFSKDKFQAVIDDLTTEKSTSDPKFLSAFASIIFDKDESLCINLYNKMVELNLPINVTQYNYFLWNAAHFNNSQHLTQLISEMTFLGIRLDLNTYVKLFQYMESGSPEGLNYIAYLLGNDHSDHLFEYSTQLY